MGEQSDWYGLVSRRERSSINSSSLHPSILVRVFPPLSTFLFFRQLCRHHRRRCHQRRSPVAVLRLHGNIDGVVDQEILYLACGDLKLVNYSGFSIYISLFFWWAMARRGRESAVFGVRYTRIRASLPNWIGAYKRGTAWDRLNLGSNESQNFILNPHIPHGRVNEREWVQKFWLNCQK